MQEMEIKHGFQFIAAFLATSQEIEKQYLYYENKNVSPDPMRDIFNIAFHHSLDRVISRKEHIDLIITAYEDFKKRRIEKA